MLRVILVYAHIVSAILAVGYVLFLTVMTAATQREFGKERASRLLATAAAAGWPSGSSPLTLRRIGWLVLIAATASGLLCLLVDSFAAGPFALGSKLVLLALLFVCFRRIDAAPIWLACTRLVIVLAIVVVSGIFFH